MQLAEKDYTKWKSRIFKLKSITDLFLLDRIDDGVYSIGAHSSNIDILIRGIKDGPSNKKTPCLVFFGGALVGRPSSAKPPFFSGLGISSSTGLPLISISDPTLAFSDTLLLSWYSGNKGERTLPVVLSAILDYLAERYNLNLILVGGSGGGFAALCQACLLRCPVNVVVWNPQTDISKYSYKAVLKYLSTAFPDDFIEDLYTTEEPERHNAIKNLLDDSGIFYSLTKTSIPSKAKVLYLQNIHDWHVLSHAKPFLINDRNKWSRIGKNSFSNSINLAIYFGDWGPGHSGPPGDVIASVIKKIVSGNTTDDIATHLSIGAAHPEHTQFFLADHLEIKGKFSASLSETPKGLRIIVNPPEIPCLKNLEYAVYVFVEGVKNVYWYQHSPEFEVPFSKGQIEAVRVFIRDIWQDVKWSHIEIK